jgi:transcriptional regulator with GAF, ATPase, and Fis domain
MHMITRIIGGDPDETGRQVLEEIRRQIPSDYPWPGNVREMEQCIRRILLKRTYEIDRHAPARGDVEDRLIAGVKDGTMDAQTLLADYCKLLFKKYGSYEAVARKTALDRRTVKKYIGQ